MILVDTSVWVDHFRTADARLTEWLVDGQVLCHPLVVGELACGNLRQRGEVLDLLRALPRLPALTSEEALAFIDAHRLMGKGLGWVDVHLLGSAYVAREALWTKDRRLGEAAQRLGLTA
jgi:predicted nucleic acid-binding protein